MISARISPQCKAMVVREAKTMGITQADVLEALIRDNLEVAQ